MELYIWLGVALALSVAAWVCWDFPTIPIVTMAEDTTFQQKPISRQTYNYLYGLRPTGPALEELKRRKAKRKLLKAVASPSTGRHYPAT
uniref:Uncharacterized protein n=1 Tax=Aquisalinus luteolus TaxID=1566827 RepID=A0A8J3A9V3_9PROT|nr:hypothetical protein GCM10011355_27210 [Aquisalinus luteolus]